MFVFCVIILFVTISISLKLEAIMGLSKLNCVEMTQILLQSQNAIQTNQLKTLSQRERKTLSCMISAFQKKENLFIEEEDIKALKNKLDHSKPPATTLNNKILKGTENFFFNRISSKKLIGRLKEISPDLKKSYNTKEVLQDINQKINAEIARLDKSRTHKNIFLQSSNEKIEILRNLSYLLIAPENLPQEEIKKYFDAEGKAKIGDLIDKYLHQIGEKNKTRRDALFKNRNILFKDSSNITASEKLIKNLKYHYGEFTLKLEPTALLPNFTKKSYEEVVILGDSLTDKGNLYKSSIIGQFAGINPDNSPHLAFTNAYPWSIKHDAMLANKTIIKAVEKKIKPINNADIGDFFITNLKKIPYTLNNSSSLEVSEKMLTRTYAIGGLTAYNYKKKLCSNISAAFARLFVSSLELQLQQLLADDVKNKRSLKDKEKTLIVEFSGANDLITVNKDPTKNAVDRALNAKMETIESLIQNGYRKVVMFNLPDVSLTPRFQNLLDSDPERVKNAHTCSKDFNTALVMRCAMLRKLYPNVEIEIFDANEFFKDVINNLDKYGFNADYAIEVGQTIPNIVPENKLFLSRNDQEKLLSYTVVDPCGQLRKGSISYNEFSSDGDNFSDLDLEKIYKEKILAITEMRGHTLSDLMMPLKESKAFENYLKDKKACADDPKLSEKFKVLPGRNFLFYDDVHPSARMHALLEEHFQKFLRRKNYEFIPPDIAIDA